MKVKHFPINTTGNDYVVGDIHGCYGFLYDKLEKVDIPFNFETDRLFSVGDIVDRGPNSEMSIGLLEESWFFSVRGNHEQMAIDAADGFYDRHTYIYNGGEWFLDLNKKERKIYAEAFSKLPLVIEVETDHGLVGIVHAEAPVRKWVDINMASPQSIMWNRDRVYRKDTSIVEGIDMIYAGHTPLKESLILGNHHFIDTGAFHTGNLTIVKI